MLSRIHLSRIYLITLGLFLLLLAVRVPFYLTHHIQEDAYITLRCAETLAESGTYGFNPGQRVSASTSHLYVFIAALVRLIAGNGGFVPDMQVLNTCLFLFGSYFTAAALAGKSKGFLWLWALISLLPISLLISYSGMETSLLVFVIGGVLYLLQSRKHPWLAWLGIALLPWLRPDAVAFALILIFWHCVQEKRFMPAPVIALLLGVLSLLAFNQLYFGALLNQSIAAKSLSRLDFTWTVLLKNLRLVFAEGSGGLFNPIRTKFTDALGYLFLLVTLAGMGISLWHKRQERHGLILILTLVSIALAVPGAYAAGGVIFTWYMWPSTFFAFAILADLLMRWINSDTWWSKIVLVSAVLGVAAGLVGQWMYAFNWGTKEYAYRGGIGTFLAEESQPGDTLFLEPAGYIPFYSGLFTYDEVGLVSPLVVHYREVYESRWWMEFVRDAKPDWIVQRGHFREFITYQGYKLDDNERKWFIANYGLAGNFSYQASDYTTNPMLVKLLTLGTADDYLVFHFVGEK